MDHVSLTKGMGDWILPEDLAGDQGPDTVRFEQSQKDPELYRSLTSREIKTLKELGNRASDWKRIKVVDPFDPTCIRQTEFHGLVRIGRTQPCTLTHQDTTLPTGITHSRVDSCDLGHDVAVHDVSYLGHTLVGDRAILLNCGEILTTARAKFGISQVKIGETEEAFQKIHVMHEAGERGIGLFEGLTPADAMLWARYRDRQDLMTCLEAMTRDLADARCGRYGEIGDQCVIKHTGQVINVHLGSCTDVVNAHRLEEVTVASSTSEPVTIGEGVTLRHGVVGPGCRIVQGVRAESFALGGCVELDHGVRLRHSVVGDHSTIACGEVLHSLIFPCHRQTHNSSFLAAACLMGQTHLAAGTTFESNHNSGVDDNELCAGRGFWSGLNARIKQPSRFASFVLLDRGDFPYELNITLPFSLVTNDTGRNQLKVTPAHWWLYGTYVLVQNAIESRTSEVGRPFARAIETQILAPDTIGEIQQARSALEVWIARAHLRTLGRVETDIETLRAKGRHLLAEATMSAPDMDVTARGLENSKRGTVIVQAFEGYHAYGDMLLHYGVTQLIEYLQFHGGGTADDLAEALSETAERDWVNLGGQIMPSSETYRLIEDVCAGALKTWAQVHERYETLWKAYPLAKQRHAYRTLCDHLGVSRLDRTHWHYALDRALAIQEALSERIQAMRKEDLRNPFAQSLFRSPDEMQAVLGGVQDDTVLQEVSDQTRVFATQVQRFKRQK